MNTLRFLLVFTIVTVITTVVAIAAAFTFWSFLSVQPGTATALATLFLGAPAIGIVAGIVAAIRATRPATNMDDAHAAGSSGWSRWLSAAFAAVVGWVFGHSVGLVAIDLSHPHRLIDPASAPGWLSAIPTVAGLAAAAVLAMVALSWRRPPLRRQT